ncbi:hypothetical protein Tco_1004042 [Tanacetum coccineum]|uniref:Uncharacterized protein n=1 Tax=Tanacetum coccineum TaxID=301880 RepID=A0ABQ5FBE6_9ASTR
MVYFVDGVLASGVEIILEMDFVRFALQELEIHSFMIQIRTLLVILQMFSTTLHNPSTRHTRIKDYRNERIDIRYRRECEIKIDELKGNFNGMSIEINKKKELRQLEQAANLSTYTTEPLRRFTSFYDDDDYEESTIPLNEIVSQILSSIAITPVLLTIEPSDTLLIGDEVISTIPARETGECIKFSVYDLVPIPKELEVTSVYDDLEYTLSTEDREIDFDPIRYIEELERLLADDHVPVLRVFDERLGNSDSISRSFDVTYSNPLFDFDDNFPLRIDNKIFDDDFEDLCSLDPLKVTPLLDESILLVTPPPASKQFSLREVERFDHFFSLTQSGDMTWVMERPSYRFPHMPSPRPAAYSPKVVMYRYFHPHLISGDGFDH